MDSLHVSEKFYSMQGEGQTIGVPAVFLRLSGCNLLCTWCDTIEVWKKGVKTEFKDVLSAHDLERLGNGAHLVITGGEPLLHQDAIIKYLTWLNETYFFNSKVIVEIETNGTVMPKEDLIELVQYWNVSPKLKNSAEPADKRIKEDVLQRFNILRSIFKFVIAKESDYVELMQDFGLFINMKKVVLMPCGENQKQLNKTRQMAAELAIQQGHRYSDRLHVVIWNEKTGV